MYFFTTVKLFLLLVYNLQLKLVIYKCIPRIVCATLIRRLNARNSKKSSHYLHLHQIAHGHVLMMKAAGHGNLTTEVACVIYFRESLSKILKECLSL